jgi:S-formylglutathione hydrolase
MPRMVNQPSRYVESELVSELVPSPAAFSVLLPPGYGTALGAVPLLLFLHGGNGSRDFLANMRPLIEQCWADGTLPPMVVATPSAGRSFYMDYRDGSQQWETFVSGPFTDHLRSAYEVIKDPSGTLLIGISMGGMGGLRMAFRNPERYRAVVALEPGVDPAFEWKDLRPEYKFYRPQELFEEIYGRPVDEGYWAATNPASMVAAGAAARIRDSGLAIYLDAGDQDFFNLHVATEFLHRALWDNDVPHEYHLVRWADHVGGTVRPRMIEGFEFLARALTPPEPDEAVQMLRAQMGPLKARASQ